MPKTLCVVTAVYRARPDWLVQLGDSLAALDLPEGWCLVWAVQEDGSEPVSESVTRRFPFARYESLGIHSGAAVARNRALSRVGGDLVTNIDNDDVAASGIGEAVRVLETRPDLVWAAGPVDDLLPDGTLVSVSPSMSGEQRPGAVSERWWRDQNLPFHTVGFVCRVAHWRAVGGWLAMPTMSDDTAALMSVTDLWPGIVTEVPHARWRRHADQNSSAPPHSRGREISWPQIQQRLVAQREVLSRI